jgi:hypothetical protein
MDIEDLIDRVVEGGREGLRELAERILETSNNNIGVGDPELDPNLAISLREAGKVVEEGNGFIIVYDTAYAAKQHEALTFKHPRGGGPKYLERSLIEHMRDLDEVVASHVRANMLGGSERSHHRGRNH